MCVAGSGWGWGQAGGQSMQSTSNFDVQHTKRAHGWVLLPCAISYVGACHTGRAGGQGGRSQEMKMGAKHSWSRHRRMTAPVFPVALTMDPREPYQKCRAGPITARPWGRGKRGTDAVAELEGAPRLCDRGRGAVSLPWPGLREY